MLYCISLEADMGGNIWDLSVGRENKKNIISASSPSLFIVKISST